MDRSGANERLGVTVETAPMREMAAVTTSLRVERWDEEQSEWTLSKLSRDTAWPADKAITPALFGRYGVKPYLVTQEDNCNLVTLAGWAAFLGGVGGTSITNKFSSTYGRIGIGTSTTTPTAADTTLGGDTGGSSTTSYFALAGVAPTITTSAAPATWVLAASFSGSVANFAWQEFGTDNYNSSGVTATGLGGNLVFINHGLSNQGTKTSGQTWTATETISFGYPSGSGTVS